MSELIKISNAVNLAVHALIELSVNTDVSLQVKEISEKFSTSEAHLSKVLQQLRKAGFVHAVRGPKGGYQLLLKPSEIKLSAIFSAIEGPIEIHSCLFGRSGCGKINCKLGNKIKGFNQEIFDFLNGCTLADVVEGKF
ncbi:MAG: Rrf2 family transcriptional regulator [Candidatus Riflebacteria bacterium]|nr:Rrf2 family transcriptional regulator [Candidatus Riflebacteria bacterium]